MKQKLLYVLLLAVAMCLPATASAQGSDCSGYITLPYSTGFEGVGTDSLPACWTQIQASAGYGGVSFPCAYNYSGNARNGDVYFEFETHSGETEVVALPAVEDVSSVMLTFWASAQSYYLPALFEVGVMEDTVFVPVDTITFTTSSSWSSGYNEYTVYFANYSGTGDRIAMRATGDGSSQYTLMMDDFTISEFTGCYPLQSVSATNILNNGLTLNWSDPLNSGASYTIRYWADTNDVNVINNVSGTSYDITGLEANTTYTFEVTPNCTAGDGLAATGSFKTDCANGSCTISVTSTAEYSYSYYCATLHVFQAGIELASVCATTQQMSVCSGDTVTITYSAPSSTWYTPTAVVTDGAGTEIFNGAVDTLADGDTVLVIANACPSCLPVTDLAIDEIFSDGATITWSAGTASSWLVSIDGEDEELVSTNSYTVYGLDAMTAHTVSVRTYCDVDDTAVARTIDFATPCADATCKVVVNMADSYGDGWNGNAINVLQAGMVVSSSTILDGASAVDSVEVCSTSPVTITFTRGNYPNEMQGTINDASGAVVFTIADMGNYYTGDTLATLAIPCPSCSVPTNVTVDSIADATQVTIRWEAGDASAWVVTMGDNTYSTSDTFYTFYGLEPLTAYTVGVATDCGGDLSNSVNVNFVTPCGGTTCESVVEMTDSYGDGWNGNAIEAYQSGVLVGTASITGSGSSASASIAVCSGVPVEYRLHVGSYPSEIGFTIYDGGGAEVYTAAQGSLGSTTDGMVLDSVTDPCPTCITPSGVTVTTVDSSMITFTWPTEAGYTYLTSFNGGAYSVNNTGAQTQYNLEANTVYTFSVKVVCSEGDTSNARTISQRTACTQMIIPYVQDFESDSTDEVPSCWNAVSGTATVNGNTYYAHGGTRSLRMAGGDMIASSAIPLQGDSIYVSFWSSIDYSGTIEAGVMTNPLYDSTFVSMVSVPAGNGYEFFEFNTSTLSADSTYYLAFRFNGSYSSASIDDITIDRYSGCMTPSSLVATPDSVTSEVVLDWVNNGTSSEFVIEYREVGGDWSAPIYAPGVTTYSLTSLSYATNYEIRVGLVCGTDTLWTMTSVMTACQAYSLPYFENFYSADGTLPPCWDVSNASVIKYDNWPNANGNGALQGGHYSAGEYALVPRLSMPIAKLEMSFDAKVGNIEEGDGMMIGVYSSLTGTVEWTDTLQVVGQCRENYVRFTCNFLDYTGTGDRIAISHSHNNPSDWGFYVDSLIIVALPECNPPENLTAHNTMYPSTADDIYFTWTVNNEGTIPSSYQLYIDTITSTVAVDSVPDSLLISVDTNYYMPPINTLAEGAHYRLFVRSSCGTSLHSNWVELQNGFATDEYWMNNTGVADTIVGCDFIIYDNGGPVAGYLHNSNSALVIQAGEPGRELQIQGAFINTGDDQSTFTVYDGIGVNDSAVLYTRSLSMAHDQFDYLDSVLATSTNGALTITFTSGYSAALGYELYVHCVGDASCEKPTNLQVEMVGEGQAYATWNSTGASLYRVYHHANGDSVWNMQPTTTNSITLSGLPADVTYDFYVVAYCSATDTSAPSIIRHFSTHYDAPVCDTITNLTVSNIGQTSATLEWTSDGTLWEVEFNGTVISTPDNPCSLSGLTVGTDYSVRVRNVCDASADFYSEWSTAVSFRTDTIPVEPQGIDDVNGTAAVALYPNPASTTVTIAVRGISGTATVTLVDLNGRTCGSWKAEDGQLVLDLGGMARGAYFVRVTGENTSVVRKLVLR